MPYKGIRQDKPKFKKTEAQLIAELSNQYFEQQRKDLEGIEADPITDPGTIGSIAKLAGLPLMIGGKKVVLPIMKRVMRDKALMLGKRSKERGTYELLQGVLKREGYLPDLSQTNPVTEQFGRWVPTRAQKIGIYNDILRSHFGLSADHPGAIQKILEADPVRQMVLRGVSKRSGDFTPQEAAAMIRYLEWHDPTRVNHLAPQEEIGKLVGWSHKIIEDYIR